MIGNPESQYKNYAISHTGTEMNTIAHEITPSKNTRKREI